MENSLLSNMLLTAARQIKHADMNFGQDVRLITSLILCILTTTKRVLRQNIQDPDEKQHNTAFHYQGLYCSPRLKQLSGAETHRYLETPTCEDYTRDISGMAPNYFMRVIE